MGDGGITLNQSPSTMFGSVLSYVSLRLLGVEAEEEYMLYAKKFIHKEGGADTPLLTALATFDLAEESAFLPICSRYSSLSGSVILTIIKN